MDPKVIVGALVAEFGTNERQMNREEVNVFTHICSLLKSDMEVVEEIQTLGFAIGQRDDQGDDMDFGDDEMDFSTPSSSQQPPSSQSSTSASEYQPSPTKKPRTSLSNEYKEKAYLFWTTNGATGELLKKRKAANTVLTRYRLITKIQILYDYEKTRNKPTIRAINLAVLVKFREMVERCAIIHDRTLRLWALQIAAEIDPVNTLSFKASPSWVYRFKYRNQIVSRAITHRVGKNWKTKEAVLVEKADQFVLTIRQLIINDNILPCNVLNFDQSRFEKELHSYRTLRERGAFAIRASVGSVAATTHSYMVMPVVTMDGEIMRPMYVLIAEAKGVFPKSKKDDPPNIKSYAGRTANMTKDDLRTFYTDVFWPSIPEKRKILLLLDSWTSNKDDALSDQVKPNDVELIKQLIPGGCTGMIQPLDVYFFRPYKSFVRFITDTAIQDGDVNIWHRDRFLDLQSFAIFQFSAPRFRNMIRFAFYKSGYLDMKPETWISPYNFCFDSIVNDKCFKCGNLAFVKCAHCEMSICMSHALFDDLHIDCSIVLE